MSLEYFRLINIAKFRDKREFFRKIVAVIFQITYCKIFVLPIFSFL